MIKIKIYFDGLNESEVLLVCCVVFDFYSFFDCVFALGVLRKYFTVIAIYDVNVFIDN